jgi:hypothetical protein
MLASRRLVISRDCSVLLAKILCISSVQYALSRVKMRSKVV